MSGELHSAACGNSSVRAPRGGELSCKGWAQEAALRLFLNSLNWLEDEVGCAARGRNLARWRQCRDAIVGSLRALGDDETLVVHLGGEPDGVAMHVERTHEEAPRCVLCEAEVCEAEPCDANLRDAALGGSWLEIGSQPAVLEAFEVLQAAGERHFAAEPGEELVGRLIVSGGMGAAGGALALAATMVGAAFLGIEADAAQIKRRLRSGECDFMVNSLDEALRILKNAVRKKENLSVGLVGNCARLLPELAARGVVPDILTDQSAAHDALNGDLPDRMTVAEALRLRECDPEGYERRSLEAMARQIEAMLRLQKMGSVVFDFGNGLRAEALRRGVHDATEIPEFASEYLRSALCQGRQELRLIALSGEAREIALLDDLVLSLFPDARRLRRWIAQARRRIGFQGLPARSCWLERGEQAKFAVAVNELVRQGRITAPVMIGRAAPVWASNFALNTSAQRECAPEAGRLACGAPALNELLKSSSGASWLAVRHGSVGGWQPAGCAAPADGGDRMALRLERMLNSSAGCSSIRSAEDSGRRGLA